MAARLCHADLAIVIFNLKNFAPDDFREKQEVRHSIDEDVQRRRELQLDKPMEAMAQERREQEEGE